jgi:hypothetical protein
VREAGFAPNEFQAAYERADLLERYALLVRELGRLPTDGDLRLKANNDPSFPSDRPFRRFGTKGQLVREVAEFCRERGDYDDVVQICAGYLPRSRDECGGTAAPDVVIGCVYLIRSGRFHKIGRSNCVGRREYELAIQLPERATTVHVIRTDDPSGIEAYWHRRFESKRKNGEWFELDAADVSAFKRRKFM